MLAAYSSTPDRESRGEPNQPVAESVGPRRLLLDQPRCKRRDQHVVDGTLVHGQALRQLGQHETRPAGLGEDAEDRGRLLDGADAAAMVPTISLCYVS